MDASLEKSTGQSVVGDENVAKESSVKEIPVKEIPVEDNLPKNSTSQERAVDDMTARPFVDLRTYHEPNYDAGGSRLAMLIWWLFQSIIFPLSPHFAHGVRRQLLRLFGATIGAGVRIRPTARFTYPWNVAIGDYSWVGDDAVFYSLAPITVGSHCVISQKSYLCTGSHDISDTRFSLITGEIVVENGAWVAADCFVGPSVRIGANAVIAARSSVLRSMPAGQVCAGTPCVPKRLRPMSNR